jgi:hypothetical protein
MSVCMQGRHMLGSGWPAPGTTARRLVWPVAGLDALHWKLKISWLVE